MRAEFTTIIVLSTLIGGCADSRQVTPQQAAVSNWNATRAAVLMGLARDQFAGGSFEKCRQTLADATKIEPTDATIRVLSAKLFIEQGQLENAEEELKLARALDPKLADADYFSGVVYQRWQQPKRALEFYETACEKAPSELAYLMAKAETMVALGRQVDALKLLQDKVAYFEHSPVIRDAVGMLLLQQGQAQDAVDMFRRASILSTDDLGIREHLAIAEFQANQYVEAADELERLIKDKTRANRSDLYQTLAECQVATGRAAIARGTAQTACDLNPSAPSAWLTLAKISMELGDLHRTQVGINKALELDPSNSQAHLLAGYLHLRQNNLTEALASFNKSAQLDSADTTALDMAGYTLARLDRPREAANRYSQALKVDPADDLAGKLMADVQGR